MTTRQPLFAAIDPETKLPPQPTVDALIALMQVAAVDPAVLSQLVQEAVAAATSGEAGVRVDVASPSASWVIAVPSGFGRVPEVSVYLSSGELVFADVVASDTQVTVTLAAPTSGFVILT